MCFVLIFVVCVNNIVDLNIMVCYCVGYNECVNEVNCYFMLFDVVDVEVCVWFFLYFVLYCMFCLFVMKLVLLILEKLLLL